MVDGDTSKAELGSFKRMVLWLRQWPTAIKVLVVILVDLCLLVVVALISYMIRLSALILPSEESLPHYLIAPLISVALAGVFGIYQSATRTFSTDQERRVIFSQLAVPLIWVPLLYYASPVGFARSVVIIYTILAAATMVAVRHLAARLFRLQGEPYIKRSERTPVVVYGAGPEGLAVVEALRQKGRFDPLAFVDSDHTLADRKVGGLRVYTLDNLRNVIADLEPKEVIMAKNMNNRTERRKIVDFLLDHGLNVKIIPNASDVVQGNVSISDLRSVRLEDLLGRDPVPPIAELMAKAVGDQVVMITGAGGSIGSELCRQVCSHKPRKIILFEVGEFALFEIDREIRNRIGLAHADIEVVSVLADVKDVDTLTRIIRAEAVDVIFHAAAYKHVGLVQDNPVSGMLNNIWGTKTVADIAAKYGVKRCIIVSTDKAVRPTSIMGATKRVAELYVQALAASNKGKTVFSMVRFGNVLGSTGSVVPLFTEQIARGGPALVTDPEVTRYFMLIPEAAELVIQAGAMAEGGEVFVLDMGEPIKIRQLAETMIELAGLSVKSDSTPSGDIEIKYIGLRDGEKLYEELQIGRDISATQHPRIMRSAEFYLPIKELQREIGEIDGLISRKSIEKAVEKVMSLSMRSK